MFAHNDQTAVARAELERLEFSPQAAFTYVACLCHSPVDDDRLRQLVGPKAHMALDQLARLRLVAAEEHRGRHRWFAIDPSIAWPAARDELTWEHIHVLGSVISPALETRIRGDILDWRGVCKEAQSIAERVYRPYLPSFGRRARNTETPDELITLQCLAFQTASRDIVAVSPSPRLPNLTLTWNALLAAHARGVRYSRITDLIEVVDHGLATVQRDMELFGIDYLQIAEHDRFQHRFYVVDKTLAIIYHRSPSNPRTHQLIGKLTGQPDEVRRYRGRFATYRAMGIPGEFVVQQLREASQELVELCAEHGGALGREWMQRLVNQGIYARFTDLPPLHQNKLATIEAWAYHKGVVISRDNRSRIRPVPDYPITEGAIRRAWERRRLEA